MTDQPAGERPGHLDIDAVSAFIDRDLHPDDVRAVETHLASCPACQREVLEIHTTILLLSSLPQYTPRRSFCLTSEHLRTRRKPRVLWPNPSVRPGSGLDYPASAPYIAADRPSGALAGLHVMALVIGALLLLVTSSDMLGIPPQPAAWLGEENEPVLLSVAAPPAQSLDEPAARVAPAPAPEVMSTATAFAAVSAQEAFAERFDGTTGDDRASEGLQATDDEAPQAPRSAVTSVAASAIQAAPTAAADMPQGGTGLAPETADAATEQTQTAVDQPSRLRLAQIVLAFALAWLIVTIAGLRWVRRLR